MQLFVIGVIAACLAAVAYGMSTVLRALGARRVAEAAADEGEGITTENGAPTLSSTMSTLVDPAFILGTTLVVLGFAGGALAARFLPLFLSQTIVSANLVITALLGTNGAGTGGIAGCATAGAAAAGETDSADATASTAMLAVMRPRRDRGRTTTTGDSSPRRAAIGHEPPARR